MIQINKRPDQYVVPFLRVILIYLELKFLIGVHLVKPDKSRYVWLYLSSKADKDRWQALANKADATLSKFCISIIGERLSEEGSSNFNHKMTKALENLRKDVKDTHENLRQKNCLGER